MKRPAEFELAEDGSVVVEFEETLPAGGPVRAGRGDALPEKVALTFEAADLPTRSASSSGSS